MCHVNSPESINTALASALPNKHETLNQCWLNVGPASKTMGQHSANIGSRVCWAGAYRTQLGTPSHPSEVKHVNIKCLVHWHSIETVMSHRWIVGIFPWKPMIFFWKQSRNSIRVTGSSYWPLLSPGNLVCLRSHVITALGLWMAELT